MSVFIAMILAWGLLAVRPLAAAGDAQAGKTVFDSKCELCHGADGKGNAVLAKSLNVTFPDFTSPDALKGKSEADLKKGIAEGYNKMKPVKGLADKQLDDVIAFVRSHPWPLSTWTMNACIDCHKQRNASVDCDTCH